MSGRRDGDPAGMLAGPEPPERAIGGQPVGTTGSLHSPGPTAAAGDDRTPDRSRRLGIRELRGRLTSLVRQAGAGERIVITIAGRPVAQLGPVEAARVGLTLDDLVARGRLEPARRADRPVEPDVRIDAWTGGRLDRALREVRGS